jgi:hypothetical protein
MKESRRVKLRKNLAIAARTAWAALLRRVGLRGRAVAHYRWILPRATSRLANYRRLDRALRRGPAGGLERASAQAQTLCLFVGHGLSGSTLVGSLLDAHPRVAIANELNYLQQLRRGAEPDELARYIRYNSAVFAGLGRNWTGYAYAVPGQHQGEAWDPAVIGDKKAKFTSLYLMRRPDLLQRLRDELPYPVVFIHAVRNPFDNIATIVRRDGDPFAEAMRKYFTPLDTIESLRAQWPAERFAEIHLEDLVADPRGELARLCTTLGVEPDPDGYLDDCAAIVFDAPQKSRHKVAWDGDTVAAIRQRCGQYSFLRRYADQTPE